MLSNYVGNRLKDLVVAPFRATTGANSDRVSEVRRRIAAEYIRGAGIELIALCNPLPVPATARVSYVDRMTTEDYVQQYPALADKALVSIDIVTDCETLSGIRDFSQEFVIANHFLEHCEDPIGTLKQFLRVLRPGGVIYLAVPDMRFTPDRVRPLTSLDHLISDHVFGPEASRLMHYEEHAEFACGRQTEHDITATAEWLLDRRESIHFHVWTSRELLELLAWLARTEPFDVELLRQNDGEVITILRKHG